MVIRDLAKVEPGVRFPLPAHYRKKRPVQCTGRFLVFRSCLLSSSPEVNMRGLIIDEPWITHIVVKKDKDWELRSRDTKIRGRIALIKKGSGQIVGTANLVDSVPRSLAYLSKHKHRHQCNRGQLVRYSNGKKLYTWIFKSVRRLKKPVSYTHPQGAVIWVTLSDNILG